MTVINQHEQKFTTASVRRALQDVIECGRFEGTICIEEKFSKKDYTLKSLYFNGWSLGIRFHVWNNSVGQLLIELIYKLYKKELRKIATPNTIEDCLSFLKFKKYEQYNTSGGRVVILKR